MAPSSSKSPDLKPLFPSYLLPAFKLPFTRPGSPPSSLPERFGPSNSISSPAASSTARRLSRTNPDTLRCSTCASDIAFAAQIVSKGFTGRYGRAYLVAPPSPAAPSLSSLSCSTRPASPPALDLLNVRVGRSENRQLVTGWHVVADITCAVCHAKLGWKYVDAREEAQKYKVGKFILETERVIGFKRWEDVHDNVDAVVGDGVLEGPASRPRGDNNDDDDDDDDGQKKGVNPDDVVFDSDDEDECEDIFAGTWDPVAVAERRGRKASAAK
ncbi:Protein yippee-like [Verticillium longisporum]|nr:Protein yippee-like [Verticillium longisporum]